MSGMSNMTRQLHGGCAIFTHPSQYSWSIVARCVSLYMYLWPRLHFAICKSGICIIRVQYVVLSLVSGNGGLRLKDQRT